jgi:UDP-N-acetylmuramate: L-alanyl-gamma-D-glutamyl-meso-diaminopimelate ligase
LAGRHNVLNALAAIAVANGRGIEREAIERALETFRGVRRRMEVKGEAGGVTVVDDFAHHPTAIRATLDAARAAWPGRRIWVAFEPRSNTMRRNVFESALAESLAGADGVVLGPVNRPHLLIEAERLSPGRVVASLRARGRTVQAFASAAEIAAFLATELQPGDVVLVMSNGSFDGLCEKLLERLHQPVRSGSEAKL